MIGLSIKKVFPLDPYDDNQLDMIKEFINNSGIESHYFNMLLDMKNNLSKEQYLDIKKQGNEIEELLIVEEDSKIRGYCHLLGEKDLKIYKLLFPLFYNTYQMSDLQSYGFSLLLDILVGDDDFPGLPRQQVEEIVREACALIRDFHKDVTRQLLGR